MRLQSLASLALLTLACSASAPEPASTEAAAPSTPEPAAVTTGLDVGQRPPDFEAAVVGRDEPFRLRDRNGATVVVLFRGSW